MNKKWWIIVLLVLFIVAAGVCYGYLPPAHAGDEKQETVPDEGQEYTYVKITSILGNEMEYVVLDAQTADFNARQDQGNRSVERGDGENGSAGKRAAAAQGREMPPESAFFDMAEYPLEGQKQQIEGTKSKEDASGGRDTIVMTYDETEATGQMQIPVGTEVETKLGTVTTFSRLSNGDIIKMLLQKDDTGNMTLVKIWIME